MTLPTGQIACSDVNVEVGSAATANVGLEWIRNNTLRSNGTWASGEFSLGEIRGFAHLNCLQANCNCNCNCGYCTDCG